MSTPLDNLEKVAAALAPIRTRFVFAGAGILPLLVEPQFVPDLRSTEDVDAVVRALHLGEWIRLRDELLKHGFRERADAGKPRQILFWLDDIPVDFIPPALEVFGFSDRWLEIGYQLAEETELRDGRIVERLSAPAFLAAKTAAFLDRGRQDVLASKDLEDIVALIVGRPALAREVGAAPPEMSRFIRDQLKAFQRDPGIWDSLEGHAGRPESYERLLVAFKALVRSGRSDE